MPMLMMIVKLPTLTPTPVTVAVTMPHGKLHVLFGLLLMTQYFTNVTTSVSLTSSSSSSSPSASFPSRKSSSVSLSASDSSSFPLPETNSHSSSSSSSLGKIPSFHLPHHNGRLLRRSGSKSGDLHLVPYSYFIPHTGSGNHSTRLSRMALDGDGEEVPRVLRKHQKRHSGNEGNTSSNNNRHHHRDGGGNRIVESESETINNNAVVALGESHLLSTPSNSSLLPFSNNNETISSQSSSPPSSPISQLIIPVGSDLDRRAGGDDAFLPMCRHKKYLPPNIYAMDTCAFCYRYMNNIPTIFGKPSLKLLAIKVPVMDLSTNRTFIILGLQDANGTRQTFRTQSGPRLRMRRLVRTLTGCCRAAEQCCERMVASWKQSELDGPTTLVESAAVAAAQEPECPPTWDGWTCWNSTKPGQMAESYCPNYIFFLTEAPACAMPLVKECDENGTWAKRHGSEWTNYSICALSKVLMQRNRSYVLVTAYAISIVALVPAIIIFFSFKQLRVHRIILHQNLFFSLILNALLVIILNTTVMMSETNSLFGSGKASIVRQNGIACRLLLISTKYLRLTNYMWMLCEGFYLHRLIAAAFAEQKSLLVFYLIGWVFPLFPTAFYAGYRIIAANEQCWVVPQEEWEWALNGPSLLSLLVNTLFLINIIRVLVTKLRAAHAQEPSQYTKAVRATLVLLPLFGLHFIVTIYRPSSSTGVCQNWTELYFYTNDIMDGMQGFLVALIFCYCNGEVLSLIKRSYTRWREQHFDMGPRNNSRHRPSRGSVLGRSVVSTHIYSSIPPSPETNVIALPDGGCVGSNSTSPTTQDGNTLTVNGTSAGIVTIPANSNTNKVSPNNEKVSELKSVLKNRKNKNNHTSTTATTNGNAISMYVSSEYGCVKGGPGVEISCV